MDPSYLYNFQKRSKSDRIPRSLDASPKLPLQLPTQNSQTIPVPQNQVFLQFPNVQNKKVIFNQGQNTKIYHPLKKLKLNESHNISYAGIIAYEESLNLSFSQNHRELKEVDKTTGVINMKLEVKSTSKNKSPIKGRSRFLSKSKGNQKEILSIAAERKTLIDYIRNRQDTFLDKDHHNNKVFKLEPMKKPEQEYVDKTNRRLLHIQKLKPSVRARDTERQLEEKKKHNLTDSKICESVSVNKKRKQLTIQPSLIPILSTQEYDIKTESAQIMLPPCSSKEEKRLRQKERRFDPEVCAEYAPSKRGFIGKKDYFVFGLSDRPQDSINKIEMYRDFLWKINFSNGLFINPQTEIEQGYRVYVGKGNNSMLIRGLMKRRFWWTIVDKPEDAHFSWTQIKNPELIRKQITTQITHNNSAFNTLSSKNLNYEYLISTNQSPTEKKSKRSRNQKRRKFYNTDSDTDRSVVGFQKINGSQIEKGQKTVEAKDAHSKIFNQKQLTLWKKHIEKFSKLQSILDDKVYVKRSWLLKAKQAIRIQSNESFLVTNHFLTNTFIGNKKALFYAMRKYYQLTKQNVFTVLPVTFHISSKGVEDPQYQNFLKAYKQFEEQKEKDRSIRNIWIAKPGQFTNRGTGITVCASLDDIKLRLRGREKNANGTYRTFILQKYIEKPLLYNKRKFDIRHYMLLTCVNGNFKGYWYEQGYLRTSSYQFSTKNYKDPQIHLTNDAIQKHNESYGKYEKGNKLSYLEFQKYLDSAYKGKNYDFFNDMLPRMKAIAANAIKSSYFLIDPEKKQHNFQVFGLDFMIDEAFNPWLIQVNTNPCLELGCPLLARLIPGMVQNAIKIGLDPLFPPPYNWQMGKKYQLGDDVLNNNRFEIIFDQTIEGLAIQQLYTNIDKIDKNMGQIQQQDEQFEQQTGKQWDGQL